MGESKEGDGVISSRMPSKRERLEQLEEARGLQTFVEQCVLRVERCVRGYQVWRRRGRGSRRLWTRGEDLLLPLKRSRRGFAPCKRLPASFDRVHSTITMPPPLQSLPALWSSASKEMSTLVEPAREIFLRH